MVRIVHGTKIPVAIKSRHSPSKRLSLHCSFMKWNSQNQSTTDSRAVELTC